MSKTRLCVAALLGIGIALVFGQPLTFSQSSAPAQPPAPLKEIHGDRKCKILQDEIDFPSRHSNANHLSVKTG
jgi:hypothetical protein